MPRDSAVELMDFNPFLDTLPEGFSGPQENRRVKERFKQYVSIGFYRDLDAPDGSQMRYYLYGDRHKLKEDIKTYTSLVDLAQELEMDADGENIFDHNPKLYIMGHGGDDRYGVGGDHPKRIEYEHFLEDPRIPTDASEQIHGVNFDKIINDLREVVTHKPGELSITLEVCNSDNVFLGDSLWGHTKTFLARLSETHKDITFSGTGPWDTSYSEAAVTTGNRAGADALHTPITSMGGNVWKHGNTVVFYHTFNMGEDTADYQVVVKKSKFASTETAKALKINTINYAAAVLENAPLSPSAKKSMLQQISENPKILKMDDLKIIAGFPGEAFSTDRAIALAQTENDILTKEKDSYIQLVQMILEKGDAVDERDLLELALGLKDYAEKGSIEGSVFEGHQALLDRILANRRLLELVMVTSGKVLIATPNNDSLIDLLQSKGVSVNSVDEHGMTALHYAVQNFYVYRAEPRHLVEKLLACGANVDLPDKTGQTLASIAMKHGSKGMVMGGQQLIELIIAPMIEKAKIPGISIATLSPDGVVTKASAGVTNQQTPDLVTDATIFQAASLSKPVFAYLVLKMVQEGKFSRPGETPESGLDRPLHEICDFGPPALRDDPNYKLLTVRSILSHQAGLPNWFKPGEPESYIAPAKTRFDYSGMAYCFLNDVVEHIAGKPLHEVSREMFDKEPLNMSHSGFVPFPEDSAEQIHRAVGHHADGEPDIRAPSLPSRANPAASLVTTAEDYAKFLKACLHDEFIRMYMFEQQLNLAGRDQKAMDAKVSEEALGQISWGMGMGLQTAENGDMIAFHWGDNETSRAFMAINLRTHKAVACFTNSANGPSIFQQIAEPTIGVGSLASVSQWLSHREGLPFEEEMKPNPTQSLKARLITLKSTIPTTASSASLEEEIDSKVAVHSTLFSTVPKPPGT